MTIWSPGAAQQAARPDSATVHPLETVVVTADRSTGVLASSTVSVSALNAERLSLLPGRGIADVLSPVPGFAFLESDGLGLAPRATVRGFYGGGETAYVLLLVDGRPVNTVESGAVNWNAIPRTGIESIEVIRGGASSLYGDAAVGGVINVITTPGSEGGSALSAEGGTHDSFDVRARTAGVLGDRAYSVSADVTRTDGFRDHAERTFGTLRGRLALAEGIGRSLTFSTLGHWRSYEDPGPLPRAVLEQSRRATTPFFRFDETDERSLRLALDGTVGLGARARLSAAVTGEYRHVDQVRTLPLSVDFADTKNRVFGTTHLGASVQATASSLLLADDRFTVGLDGAAKLLDTRYHAVVDGGEDDYLSADGRRGPLDARGDGRRLEVGSYVQYDWWPVPRVRLTAGSRLDLLSDVFEPDVPDDAERTTADHSAFSPKAGVNVRYTGAGAHRGHVYANVSRSFKAATVDQLFDQRTTPVPFPPFVATVSNPELVPQHGTSVEVGLYHRVAPAPGRLTLGVTVSAYHMAMEDELDFDFASFRFVNLAESRHRGVEGGVTVEFGERAGFFLNYTLQDVTAEGGDNDGKQLKAIPREHWSAGFTAGDAASLGGGLTLSSAHEIYIDDANTVRLPSYTTIDARISYGGWGPVSVFLEAFNLFDASYSSTAFPDPAGSEAVFFHPAAGRTLRVGVNLERR